MDSGAILLLKTRILVFRRRILCGGIKYENYVSNEVLRFSKVSVCDIDSSSIAVANNDIFRFVRDLPNFYRKNDDRMRFSCDSSVYALVELCKQMVV